MIIPLFKSDEKNDVCPLGFRNRLIRLFHKEAMKQVKPEVQEYLESQQLGQSQSGPAKLVFSVSGMLELHPDFICIKTYLKNCYNEQSKHSVVDVLCDTKDLSHMTTFAATVLSPESSLESQGKVMGTASEGLVQGDPASGAFQAIGLQPSLVTGWFSAEIKTRLGLKLQWTKSQIYCKEGDLPENATPGLSLAGEQVGDSLLRGMMVYGVPIGTPQYRNVVSGDRQALSGFGLLSDSASVKDLATLCSTLYILYVNLWPKSWTITFGIYLRQQLASTFPG